jgi:hypothetical protein
VSRPSFTSLGRMGVALAATLTALALVACNGPTIVDAPEGAGDFRVTLSMDPATLNPPQLSTINYTVSDGRTGKPVAEYTPALGALFHNVLISRDLIHFKHSYTSRLLLGSVSLQTYFPTTGKYNSYGIFNPAEADVNVYAHTVQAGDEGPEPNLVDDADKSKVARQYGLRLDLLTGPEPIRAGEDAQIAVYVTERGVPVTGLWPFLDSPGYLWIIDQESRHFTWEEGVSPSHVLTTTGTPSPSPTAATQAATVEPTRPVPTFIPSLLEDLVTRVAQPIPTLAPVQATAQASILEPQAVRPPITHGPYVLFGHEFPEPGLYKIWFEFMYRGQVIYADWVVTVEE